VKVRFACPECDQPARLELPADRWQCLHCDHLLAPQAPTADGGLPICLLCGNAELYRKKDFPHGLGLTILAVACLVSAIPYYSYHQWLAWAILIGTAVFDGLLYLFVGDVIVCYRCNAQYRGVRQPDTFRPFDLGIGERYRQERIRRERLGSGERG
jgi:hypothetical protein